MLSGVPTTAPGASDGVIPPMKPSELCDSEAAPPGLSQHRVDSRAGFCLAGMADLIPVRRQILEIIPIHFLTTLD